MTSWKEFTDQLDEAIRTPEEGAQSPEWKRLDYGGGHMVWRTPLRRWWAYLKSGYKAELSLSQRCAANGSAMVHELVDLEAFDHLKAQGEYLADLVRRMRYHLRERLPMYPELRCDHMEEDSWLVRGTLDPHEALQAILTHIHEQPLQDYVGWDVRAVSYDGDELADRQHDIDHAAYWCHSMLETAQAGTWRKVHCLPNSYGDGEGWGWQLHSSKPGRGAFPGVYFPNY